jgi:hypothetical protein
MRHERRKAAVGISAVLKSSADMLRSLQSAWSANQYGIPYGFELMK